MTNNTNNTVTTNNNTSDESINEAQTNAAELEKFQNNEHQTHSAKVTDEQVINWIKSRRSIGNLNIPAPSRKQVEAAIQCAITAPDHKKLRPWRFTVIEGKTRHSMGHALLAAAEAKANRDGITLDTKTIDKTLKMPLRAPLIITVTTRMQYHEKVPPFEQLLSTGATIQNLILALKSQGFSSLWRTGPLANEPAVKSFFNVGSEDYIAAFVYVGSSLCDIPTRKDLDLSEFVKYDV